MTEIGEILTRPTMELLEKLELDDVDKPQARSDGELRKISGIGPATIEKIRNLQYPIDVVAKEDATKCVSLRYLTFPGEISVNPGDEIPPEFADEMVEKGKARWL